jgi:hypothetical protein
MGNTRFGYGTEAEPQRETSIIKPEYTAAIVSSSDANIYETRVNRIEVTLSDGTVLKSPQVICYKTTEPHNQFITHNRYNKIQSFDEINSSVKVTNRIGQELTVVLS